VYNVAVNCWFTGLKKSEKYYESCAVWGVVTMMMLLCGAVQGRLHGREGFFPAECIRMINDITVSVVTELAASDTALIAKVMSFVSVELF